jgi:inosose dehydratase
MTETELRIAGAPITWGVCEAPGWGHQLGWERVLAEMADLGLRATEAGPWGWLPSDAGAARAIVDQHGLRLVAGFVPLVLHHDRAGYDHAESVARYLLAAGAEMMVIAANGDGEGYDDSLTLDSEDWVVLIANLNAVQQIASTHGLGTSIHPHEGTIVHDKDSIERVLEGSDVLLCLDTGHQTLAGVDPAALAANVADRIGHVHLKDVDASLARKVESGTIRYSDAVRAGLFRPLGHGDVDCRSVVNSLRAAGYSGWYVLEQDVMLRSEPTPGAGPVSDARISHSYLTQLVGGTQDGTS